MILEPPAIYNHPYAGPVIEHILSSEEIITVCAKGPNVLACSWPPKVPDGTCVKFMPKVGVGGVGLAMRELLDRWENARCNGWRGNAYVY